MYMYMYIYIYIYILHIIVMIITITITITIITITITIIIIIIMIMIIIIIMIMRLVGGAPRGSLGAVGGSRPRSEGASEHEAPLPTLVASVITIFTSATYYVMLLPLRAASCTLPSPPRPGVLQALPQGVLGGGRFGRLGLDRHGARPRAAASPALSSQGGCICSQPA